MCGLLLQNHQTNETTPVLILYLKGSCVEKNDCFSSLTSLFGVTGTANNAPSTPGEPTCNISRDVRILFNFIRHKIKIV